MAKEIVIQDKITQQSRDCQVPKTHLTYVDHILLMMYIYFYNRIPFFLFGLHVFTITAQFRVSWCLLHFFSQSSRNGKGKSIFAIFTLVEKVHIVWYKRFSCGSTVSKHSFCFPFFLRIRILYIRFGIQSLIRWNF